MKTKTVRSPHLMAAIRALATNPGDPALIQGIADGARKDREAANPKPQIQKVIFRAERNKAAHVSAVIVGSPGSFSAPLTVWDSQCGHGSGTWGWYQSTRPATPAEYHTELTRLQRQYAPEYEIQVVRCYTRKEQSALMAQFYTSAK